MTEPTAAELGILRQFRGGVNCRVTSFTARYSREELLALKDSPYLRMSTLSRSGWRFEATFWLTQAGQVWVEQQSTGS